MTSMRMALTDLRDSWSAWASVSITFLVTSATLGLSALVLNSAVTATGFDDDYRFLLISIGATNVLFCSMVALAVVGTSTALVVSSRRGAIARLLLAGAAPGHVVRMLLLQLIVVTLVCSVVGNAVALSSQGWVLRIIAEDRGYAPIPAVFSPLVLLASGLYCAVVAMMGGLRQARRATAIPPVEALRASSGAGVASTTRLGMVMRWIGFLMTGALIVGAAAFFRSAADDLGPDAFQNLMQMAAFSLVDVGAISLPLMMLLGILLVSWVITLLATVLPSIPSLRRPAPRVIAQLVAS